MIQATLEYDEQSYYTHYGVASSGVYMAQYVTILSVSSYLTISPLPQQVRLTMAVYFCCTFLKVAFTGSYPAPCSMKPGLSSYTTFQYCTGDCLVYSYIFINIFFTTRYYYNIFNIFFK